jgi:hypothetical protein
LLGSDAVHRSQKTFFSDLLALLHHQLPFIISFHEFALKFAESKVFHVSNTMSTSFPVVACSRVFDYANAMNIRDLIESVGGIRAAARLLGVAPSTVHYYCKHDRMPIFRLLVLTKGKLIHTPIKEHEIEHN